MAKGTTEKPETCTDKDGCDRPPYHRGLCTMHYNRRVRDGSLPRRGIIACISAGDDGHECGKPVVARGMCNMHYTRWRANPEASAPCAMACGRPVWAFGLCRAHWLDRCREARAQRCVHEDADGERCPRLATSVGYCQTHYMRYYRHGDTSSTRRPSGSDPKRYRRVMIPGRGRVSEHRYLMGLLLGRRLHPQEDVHHVNGDRLDNATDGPLVNFRSGNLELWSHSQPRGQRVVDKVEWATEILQMYAPARLVRDWRQPGLFGPNELAA